MMMMMKVVMIAMTTTLVWLSLATSDDSVGLGRILDGRRIVVDFGLDAVVRRRPFPTGRRFQHVEMVPVVAIAPEPAALATIVADVRAAHREILHPPTQFPVAAQIAVDHAARTLNALQ